MRGWIGGGNDTHTETTIPQKPGDIGTVQVSRVVPVVPAKPAILPPEAGAGCGMGNAELAVRFALIAILAINYFGLNINKASARVLDESDDPLVCGTWTYYAPGVMERSRRNHDIAPCTDCAGMAATVDQSLLGRRIEVWYSGQWRGVFHVVDVGNGNNRAGLVGEVEAEVAWSWGRAAPWWGCYREA